MCMLQYELEGAYLTTLMEGMFVSLPMALDVKLCLIANGHLCMFDQVLYPVEHINLCIYMPCLLMIMSELEEIVFLKP